MLKTAYAELNMKKLDECMKRVSIAMEKFNVSEVPSCFPSLAFAQPPNFSSSRSKMISETPPAYKTLNLANKTLNLANKTFNLANKIFNLANKIFNLANKTFNLANKTFNLANKTFNLANKTFNLAKRRRTILCKT